MSVLRGRHPTTLNPTYRFTELRVLQYGKPPRVMVRVRVHEVGIATVHDVQGNII